MIINVAGLPHKTITFKGKWWTGDNGGHIELGQPGDKLELTCNNPDF